MQYHIVHVCVKLSSVLLEVVFQELFDLLEVLCGILSEGDSLVGQKRVQRVTVNETIRLVLGSSPLGMCHSIICI